MSIECTLEICREVCVCVCVCYYNTTPQQRPQAEKEKAWCQGKHKCVRDITEKKGAWPSDKGRLRTKLHSNYRWDSTRQNACLSGPKWLHGSLAKSTETKWWLCSRVSQQKPVILCVSGAMLLLSLYRTHLIRKSMFCWGSGEFSKETCMLCVLAWHTHVRTKPSQAHDLQHGAMESNRDVPRRAFWFTSASS